MIHSKMEPTQLDAILSLVSEIRLILGDMENEDEETVDHAKSLLDEFSETLEHLS